MTQAISAILLDLDGTLVDTAADLMVALNTVLQHYDCAQVNLAAVKSMIGDGIDSLVEKGFSAHGDLPAPAILMQAKQQCAELYQTQPSALSQLFPGVADTLRTLKMQNYKLAVCTNKPERSAHQILLDLGIEALFDEIVGGDTLPVRKPHPRHLLDTLKRLDCHADAALMVGDSRNDLSAARQANLSVILVSYGYSDVPVAQLQADQTIDSFAQLPQALSLLA